MSLRSIPAATLALALMPGVAPAQTDMIATDPILADAMNGAIEVPPLRFTLSSVDCAGAGVLDQDFDGGIHQQTTTRFDLAALVTDRHGLTDFSPALPLGELALPLTEGAEATIDIVLTDVPADQTATFTGQDFACEGGTCTKTVTAAEVKLPFEGSDPASRSLMILSRLGDLASGCAAQ